LILLYHDILNMNIVSAQALVDQALKEIETLEPTDVVELQKKQNCILIDIRDIRELWREGTVKNALHIPRGMIEFWVDPQSSYYKEKNLQKAEKVILFCALGMRSALATKSLKDMGFKNIAHVNGGFDALKKANFEITEVKKK